MEFRHTGGRRHFDWSLSLSLSLEAAGYHEESDDMAHMLFVGVRHT